MLSWLRKLFAFRRPTTAALTSTPNRKPPQGGSGTAPPRLDDVCRRGRYAILRVRPWWYVCEVEEADYYVLDQFATYTAARRHLNSLVEIDSK